MEAKRARIGSMIPRVSGGGTSDHPGSGSHSQAKVEVTYHVAPYEAEPTWTHRIPQFSLVFHTPLHQDQVKGFTSSRKAHEYSLMFTVVHINALITKEFIASANQLTQGGFNPLTDEIEAPRPLDSINYPAKLREIAKTWRLGGVCFTTPKEDGPLGSNHLGEGGAMRERDLVVWIRGDDKCKNYWGPTLHGGDHCWLVLMFVESKHHTPSFAFSITERATCESFKSGSPKRYVPQIVAVKHHSSTLPLEKYQYEVYGKKHLGIKFYVGECVKNYGYDNRVAQSNNYMPIVNGYEINNRPHVDLLLFV